MQTPRCRASSEMRILIPDLAQQDHSSSKIAVSYGLILEEYYMQRRKIQIWLGILAICTSLGTPISTYADTQDVTTNVGDKTTIKSDGSDKETTNGQEDSSDTTSGGETTVHYTEAQLKAMDAKKKLNYELRSILTEVRKNADENGMFHSPNSSIKDIGYSYGTVDVKKDQIDQILDYLKDFESVLNKDNNRQDFDVISSVTNPIFDNMHMPKKSFSEPTIEDGGGKIALMDKNGDLSLIVSASDAPSDGLLATYEKSLQTDQENGNKGQDSASSSNSEDSTDKNTNGQNGSDSNKGDNQNSSYLTGNSADDILLRQVMDAIAKKMGFSFSDDQYLTKLIQQDCKNYLLLFQNKKDPPFKLVEGSSLNQNSNTNSSSNSTGTSNNGNNSSSTDKNSSNTGNNSFSSDNISSVTQIPDYKDGSTTMPGVRDDLVDGGMNAFYTITDTYELFSRFSGSNAMNNYCTLAYIKDIHVDSIRKNVILKTNYKSNVRRWVVEKDGGSKVVVQTDDPKHQFDFSTMDPGEYTVTAYQKVTYTVGTSVKYDICEYLFDPVTNGLIYFNEQTVENGTNKSLSLDTVTKTGYVATGDVFRIHVNNLGKVETVSPSTNRTE